LSVQRTTTESKNLKAMKTLFETKVLRSIALLMALMLTIAVFEGCSSGKKGGKVQSSGKMAGAKR